ncbi:MAG: hypothetical protein ACP5K7_03060 [Verrucomicrobiia bacterium]|jgi:hypothetical protein
MIGDKVIERPRVDEAVKLRILFIIIAGSILALATYWLSSAYFTRKKIEAYAVSNTMKDIDTAAEAIRIYVEDKNKLPFKPLPDEEFLVSAKGIYPILFKSQMNNLEMVEPPLHWKAMENIVDRWNNELNILVKQKHIPEAGEAVVYYFFTIWSNGPNGINDNGSNDDIVEHFNIPVWIDAASTTRPLQKSREK